MTKVLVPLADGVEEMEAVISIDTLRRAEWEVVSVGLKEGTVTASRGVCIQPDTIWDDIDYKSFDVLLLPGGGGGVQLLAGDPRVLDAVRYFSDERKWIAAVCAGPLVLQQAGILAGKKVTCHPGVVEMLKVTHRSEDAVVVDGKLVTSQGPGTSFSFALKLVELIDGQAKAEGLARAMVLPVFRGA